MLQRHQCSQKCVARCKTSPRRDRLRGVVGQGKRRRLWSLLCGPTSYPSCPHPLYPPLPPSLAHLDPLVKKRHLPVWVGGAPGAEGHHIMLLLVSWELSNNWLERQINWDSVCSIPFNTVTCIVARKNKKCENRFNTGGNVYCTR